MKTIRRWLSETFRPEYSNEIDLSAIAESLTDLAVRTRWLENVLEMLKLLNMEVDHRLLNGEQKDLKDLCARRRAIQDVLEAVLSARRSVLGQAPRPNPRPKFVDLDRVTA